jgi:hypothetical protein
LPTDRVFPRSARPSKGAACSGFSDGSTGSPKGENREKEIEKGRIAGISLNFEEKVPSISELRMLSPYNAVQFLWMKK